MNYFFLFLFIFLFACSGSKQTSHKLVATEFEVASLADVGIETSLINKMDSQIINGTYPNIHSVLIAKNNKLVFEKYYTGKDENWGDNLGVRTHHRDSLHDIRSVSKSIVSACIGIAIVQGRIKSVNEKVLDFFPEFKSLDTGLKSQLTIRHLLTMSTGLVWNEEVPYTDSNKSEIRMIRSSNQAQFVLSQPMEHAPGLKWKYNGGATQLLAGIIEKLTGKKIDGFADEYLFQPLGITRYEWNRYPGTQIPAAASGLRLTSRDLLKFGILYLNGGRYNKQILPANWVKESMKEQITRPIPQGSLKAGYGYQFFTRSVSVNNKVANATIAIGNGNQRIFVDTENNMVVVVTAGNYNTWDIKNNSDALVYNFVYPALK